MTLTQQQRDLVFGTLLGDGNLQTDTMGRTWRYRALHKAEHEPYLKHKYDVLSSHCTTGPIYGETFDDRTGQIYKRFYFNTNVNSDFLVFGNMFYVYDKKLRKMVKRIPSTPILQKFLTPRAIAYMYMDDGALKWLHKSNAMRICTEFFPKEDVTRLRQVLFQNFNIETSQGKRTCDGVYVGDRISIPEKSSVAFRQLIEPYLIDCMKYKVSDGNKGHL